MIYVRLSLKSPYDGHGPNRGRVIFFGKFPVFL